MVNNSFFFGLIVGTVLPTLSWITFHVAYTNLILLNKPALPYLVAIAANLFIMRFFYKKEADQAVRGVMVATFVFMLMLIVFKVRFS